MWIPSLAALSIETLSLVDGADTGAPKRKASSLGGHYGLSSDSSAAVRLVVLSRLMRTREEVIVEASARTPLGQAVLHGLRGSALRVAIAVGGADASLGEAQVATLFNLSASHVATKRLYDAGLSLPSKLPWPNAKALLAALLAAVSVFRAAPDGAVVEPLLLQVPPPTTMDDDSRRVVAQIVAQVEPTMTAKLQSGDAASSSSSVRSSSPPVLPPLPALPAPPPDPPPAAEQQGSSSSGPFVIVPSMSLAANFLRLAQRQLTLSPADRDALTAAMKEGLSVLQAGGAEARRQLLETPILRALATASAAQLWACCLETTERDVSSVAALARELVDCCSSVSAVMFTMAIGI